MATPDVEAAFADDYIPPHMRRQYEDPPKKPRRPSRHVQWDAERHKWVLTDVSLFQKHIGKSSMDPVEVPEYPKSNRW